MEYVTLGRSNLNVSRIALGGIALGGGYGPVDRQEAISTIWAALDKGINFFDTSLAYGGGTGVEILGDAIAADRANAIVAAKVGAGFDSSGRFWASNRRSIILFQVEGTLRRLGSEYIDLCQIYGPDPHTNPDETLAALDELRRAGKVRNAGLCNANTAALRDTLKHGRLESLQCPYNIIHRSLEEATIRFCRATRIGILACEPFGRGLLLGKFARRESDSTRNFDGRYGFERNTENVNRLRTLADQEGLTLLQLALGWILQNPAVASVICGARNAEQIEQCASAAVELNPEHVVAIEQIVGEGRPLDVTRPATIVS
jgi:aryl-alcohol dehydrogenase-like predicted oxidoreductase